MKRELKHEIGALMHAKETGIAKPIPMKRELKRGQMQACGTARPGNRKAHPDEKGTETGYDDYQERTRRGLIAKPIPMKRELKQWLYRAAWGYDPPIAKPIPMKRELKHSIRVAIKSRRLDRKAHPDEKGTETVHQ